MLKDHMTDLKEPDKTTLLMLGNHIRSHDMLGTTLDHNRC